MYRRCLPILLLLSAVAAADVADVAVTVDGRILTVNHQATIPAGLMGVHAFNLTEKAVEDLGIECIRQIHYVPGSSVTALDKQGLVRSPFDRLSVVIDCQGDRYYPATVLTNPNFKEYFEKAGKAYAQKCLQARWPGYVEFWNEPYLNWADRSRKNYDNKYFDITQAAEGGKVTIKGWKEPLEHLRWKGLWPKDDEGRIAWEVPVPEGLKPGDTFRARRSIYWAPEEHRKKEATFTVVQEWHVYDPTQVSWWSGRQNLDFYLWMFLPYAKAVKETNPKVQVLAGWDFGLSHGNWAVWEELVRPLLDQGITWIDGITDHHYGGDTRAVGAWYEVACAYTVGRYGKWIRGYNTETGGSLDPAVHGRVGKTTELAKATYLLRDVIELMYHFPDKAGSRTAHHITAGESWALRLLKDVRGTLVHATTADPDVWPVACVNGDRMVVTIFSNAAEPREVALTLKAPGGTRFKGGQLRRLEAKGDDLSIATQDVDPSAPVKISLLPRNAAVLVLPLDKAPATAPQVARRQFFASEGVLQNVTADTPARLTIKLPAETRLKAEKAWLQLVLDGVAREGETVTIMLNGQPIDIGNRNWTTRVEVPVARLMDANDLVFAIEGASADGIKVAVASLLIETPAN